jgi:hypothetical protein
MEPQAEQETSRSRIDVDVQTVGLNAETKKCRHRAGGEDFVLTFPLIGRFHDGQPAAGTEEEMAVSK